MLLAPNECIKADQSVQGTTEGWVEVVYSEKENILETKSPAFPRA